MNKVSITINAFKNLKHSNAIEFWREMGSLLIKVNTDGLSREVIFELTSNDDKC